MRSIVVVGASLAGLRAVEALRSGGFDGRVTVLDGDPEPTDRPPLSKGYLSGAQGPDRLSLPVVAGPGDLDIDRRPGVAATGLDLPAREVALDDGSRLAFDGLVIATGATPRRLRQGAGLAGVHVLRNRADADALRADLSASPRRLVVIGAGFIGAEVAATARGMGVPVTMLEALPTPFGRALGEQVGSVIAAIHADEGVEVREGVEVADLEGGERVERVRLGDGRTIDADVVLVGIGVTPATAWLEGSGLSLADGVVCDRTCLAAPGVVAAGDVARWEHPVLGSTRVEHWDHAIDQGAYAGRRLLAGEGEVEPYAPVSWFWSDQYDHKLQAAGRIGADADLAVVAGSLAERRFVALYGRAGRVEGVVGLNWPAKVVKYRTRIASLGWDEALAEAAAAG